MDTELREKIEDKIRKLQAMAADNSGASDNEKNIAVRLLVKLAEDYAIDLGNLKEKSPIQVRMKSTLAFTERAIQYHQIATVVGRTFGVCVVGHWNNNTGQYLMSFEYFGNKAGCEQTDYLTTYLIRHIRKISTLKIFKQQKTSIEAEFAYHIESRLNKFTQDFDIVNPNAIQLISNTLTKAKDFAMKEPGVVYTEATINWQANGIGETFAEKASLNKAITDSTPQPKQLNHGS